jgi:tetratricopeptide (TPR) repeat protein
MTPHPAKMPRHGQNLFHHGVLGRWNKPRSYLFGRRLLLTASFLTPYLASPLTALAQAGANSTPAGAIPGQSLAVGAAAAGQNANPLIPAQSGAVPAGLPTPGTTVQRTDAVGVLLQQANFWHAQDQPARALESLNRALQIDPNNAEALGLLAELRADQGDASRANDALTKLKAVSPADPHIAGIERSLRIGLINPSALAEARKLAQDGRNAEAARRYEQIFKGNAPPDALAAEYYQTLAGSEGGWERARDGLAQRVRENPRDLRAQLGYAQILTYREGARAEGIARLAQLSQSAAVAEPATRAWRQALTWLPLQASSVPLITAYLDRHPSDNAIQRQLELARHPPNTGPRDTAGEARIGGFRDLDARNLAGAERGFTEALALNPNDPDALGGLGLVRLRQGRIAEARSLLNRAIAADPSRRGQWQAALAGANLPSEYAAVRVLAERGDYDGAERQIHSLMSRGGGPGLMAMLGDIQARKGDLSAAETSYRAALARAPNDAGVMVGLAGVLQQEGRTAEAEELLSQAGQRGQGSLRVIGQARAEQLRDQAKNVTDPATQEGLYRAAIASDPGNHWIRLDLARLLARRGRLPEARELMAQVTSAAHPTSDDLQAGIIFANENKLSDDAIALINRVPARTRTPGMQQVLAQAQVNRDIQANLLFPPEVAREKLLALAAAAPDPDGARGAAIARALYRIGAAQDARTAIATARAVTRAPTADAQVNYAAALLDIGDSAGAQALLRDVPTGALSPQQRNAANSLGAGLAVRTSDTLNQAGKQAEAYDHLAPALARTPENPDLNMALARLYEGAEKPQQALEINLSVLRRDPTNLVARKAAVDAAIAAGNRAQADQLVREGLEMFPNDPRSWMTSADLARARGNNLRALQDLQRARELRLQQIGSSDNGADSEPVSGDVMTLAPGAPPIYSDNPPTSPYARPYMIAPSAKPTVQAQSAIPSFPPNYANPGLGSASGPPLYPPTYAPPPTYTSPTYRPQPSYAPPPSVTYGSQGYTNGTPSQYANPFRSGSSGTSPFGSNAFPAAEQDPMTAEIDRGIASLRNDVSPSLQVGTLLRGRSGTGGLDRLIEEAVPIEATFSPGGYGQLRFSAQPTFLQAGTLANDYYTQSRYGLQAFNLRAVGNNLFYTPVAGSQSAQGVGLDLAYKYGWLSADIGSTPLGFQEQSIIGGVELAPKLSENVTLRLTGERRAVTDSVLSYAGVRDTLTGAKWGGVTRARGYAQLELTSGLANFYLGAGYASLDGNNVAHNNEISVGAGGSYPVWRNATDEIRAGLDLVYFGFSKNLDYFTYGQGGYFSPQSYLAALIPVSYSSKAIPNLTYSIGGSLGYQVFNQNSSPYYPTNSALETLGENVSALLVPGLQTSYAAKSSSGIAGTINAKAEYTVAPNLKIGATASYQHAGNYDEGEGLLYARYIFNGAE